MKKKIIILGIVFAVFLLIVAVTLPTDESKKGQTQTMIQPDVVIPIESSRPGCEQTDSCYVPSNITIKEGQQVTWSNQDSAFHTVTSGFYDKPSGLFNSGHLDPNQQFSFTFDEKGVFNYFCTLHPWMQGKVIVK